MFGVYRVPLAFHPTSSFLAQSQKSLPPWTGLWVDPQILKGRLKGHHAVSVSANWRVTFRFQDGHAVDVDYLDYH